jgi:Flp pilus assembly pilin Flp
MLFFHPAIFIDQAGFVKIFQKLNLRCSTMFKIKYGKKSGQGMVEYALLLAVVALAVVLVLNTTGVSISDVFCRIAGSLGGGLVLRQAVRSPLMIPPNWIAGMPGMQRMAT